jgi:hypothetical protein
MQVRKSCVERSVPSAEDSSGMKAFLRIRPPPNAQELSDRAKPYLEMQGDKQVIMRAPQVGRVESSSADPFTDSFHVGFLATQSGS